MVLLYNIYEASIACLTDHSLVAPNPDECLFFNKPDKVNKALSDTKMSHINGKHSLKHFIVSDIWLDFRLIKY